MLTAFVSQAELAGRRAALMRKMERDALLILPAAPVRYRNRDIEHAYRQDSDFHYLTGFSEPYSLCVLAPGRREGQYVLFVREWDPEREAWEGRRAGVAGACRDYGADEAHPTAKLDEVMPQLMAGRRSVLYTLGRQPHVDQRLLGWLNSARGRGQPGSGQHPPSEIVNPEQLLHEMRLRKSRAEIELLRESARIAAQAHVRAMRFCRPGRKEYEVMAELVHEFRLHNAATSYHPIVGGGANGCILHYQENSEELQDGDLLLIDAGCEHRYYASDITRTFPVNGRFSPEQRAIYGIVLEANQAAIAQVRAGNNWNSPHEAAVKVITRGLVKLGLLKGSVSRLIRDGAYQRFFMHRTGHWLGMDVHDVGDYKVGEAWRTLEPGMVMTIEPGIYIPPGGPPGSPKVPKRFHNIGVRIEDDVLVTRGAAEVLTADAPKDPGEIEALMAQSA
jgi:Xaa-Pro aminopeptidase